MIPQESESKKILKRNVVYTAGAHGNFISFILDCYDQNKTLPTPFNQNGNSHNQIGYVPLRETNRIELCYLPEEEDHLEKIDETYDTYAIVWEGLEQFYYMMQCYIDRGGKLVDNGIELMQKDLIAYEEKHGYPVTISSSFRKYFNFDVRKNGQPPRALLRNFFLLSFYNHFDNIVWKKNKSLIKRCDNRPYKKINLKDIWDYDALEKRMYGLTNKNMDFKSIHAEFLSRNRPYRQLQEIRKILTAVESKNNIVIEGLNVISEAYVIFQVERKYFDIPFHMANEFFRETAEINEYIDFFPNYMKRPNNLFKENYQIYKRDDDVEV